jgi:hypothetical protein
VLDEDSPLPESPGDVEELARRLRDHISQLGAVVPPGASALRRAQQLAQEGVPDGYMPSRIRLVKLAEATQELIAAVDSNSVTPVPPIRRPRWRTPLGNFLCGMVFAVAFTCPFLPRRFPVHHPTGAALTVLILGSMAWLILRGDRAVGPVVPPSEESPPTQIEPPSLQ